MVLGASSFVETLLILLIWIPIIVCWVYALFDIYQRDDLSTGGHLLWFAVVLFFPLFGTLIYLLFRPAATTPAQKKAWSAAAEAYDASMTADQLHKLSELHDRGKLTDEEFDQAKKKLLAATS